MGKSEAINRAALDPGLCRLKSESCAFRSWGVQGGASSTLVEARKRRIDTRVNEARGSISKDETNKRQEDQATKGTRWMPRRQEAKKDVGSCEKRRGAANQALIRRCPNGETHGG